MNLFAKDQRTEEEVKTDYDNGKAGEKTVIDEIAKYRTIVPCGNDEFGKDQWDYTPDAFMFSPSSGKWLPLEIKHSTAYFTDLFWKKNQYDYAKKHGVYLVSVREKSGYGFGAKPEYKIAIIKPGAEGEVRSVPHFGGKTCVVFNDVKWYNSFEEIFGKQT